MIKIWGKIYAGDKIINHTTLEVDAKSTTFFDMLKDICYKLNIPTPVLLKKHALDFNRFNICVFKADDFVESINFDKFHLEYLK